MTMRKSTVIIPIVFAFAIFLAGQLVAGDDSHSLKRGSWAMQFGISDNFTLESFDGALISAKRHLSDNSAVRFGVSLSGNIGDSNAENGQVSTNDSDSYEILNIKEGDSNSFGLSLTTQLMFYTPSLSSMKLYLGIGPHVNYTRQKTENETSYSQEGSDETISEEDSFSRSWSAGLQSAWGVEYFLVEKLSLFAEYGAGVEYVSAYSERAYRADGEEQSQVKTNISESKKVGFYSAGVNFGLSLYFN